ncbi:hypothetical protein, partial [Tateyamaria pelophila]|uniref:hypothetical protein n=1 Tax=Tateyamaria pelophila TaxID=328415 RepID=UPI001CBC2D2F
AMCSHGSVLSENLGGYRVTSQRKSTHQCQNAPFSKAFLGKDGYLDALIHQMKGIISQSNAKSVGVITYMNLGNIKNFDELLSKKLNLPKVQFKHFGGIRGTNEFSDLDLIFVVGRHQISRQDTVAVAETIFQTRLDDDIENMPSPVRMSDGSSKVLSNHVFTDRKVKATYDQQCRSETIQAIMRSRPFYGKGKDVFFFSNEALGEDVEVHSFFDFTYPDMPQYWEKMKEIGFVRTERRFLKELGYTEKMLVPKGRQGIIDNFIERGCRLVKVEGVTDQYKTVTYEYLVYDEGSFREYLKEKELEEVPSVGFIADLNVANSTIQTVPF